MTWAMFPVALLLSAVAAWGVLRPLRRSSPVPTAVDAMEEEREAALRSLRDLEDERASGMLSPGDYAQLRAVAEARAVAVLRAVGTGDGEVAGQIRSLRRDPVPRSRGRGILPAIVAAALIVAAIPPLAGAIRDRTGQEPISGALPGGSPSFFEQRVREHPRDLAARLDLADRYLAMGRTGQAIEQYVAALNIDPRSAEAHARLGLVLYGVGRPEEGLREVELALDSDPDYPEALYARGLILLRGLDRSEQAAESLRGYLREAPFGAYREEARRLLANAGA